MKFCLHFRQAKCIVSMKIKRLILILHSFFKFSIFPSVTPLQHIGTFFISFLRNYLIWLRIMKSLTILSFLWKCYNLWWLPPGVCELCSLLAIFKWIYTCADQWHFNGPWYIFMGSLHSPQVVLITVSRIPHFLCCCLTVVCGSPYSYTVHETLRFCGSHQALNCLLMSHKC